MPDEDRWSSFYDADCIVAKMECAARGDESIVEFGSGYGIFTLPAARRTCGIVQATTASLDHAMPYNILHLEDPIGLLRESLRVLKLGATASVIDWKHDSSTPRGPSMAIRPTPDDCRGWAEAAGFQFVRYQDLTECCEYHYGLLLKSRR